MLKINIFASHDSAKKDCPIWSRIPEFSLMAHLKKNVIELSFKMNKFLFILADSFKSRMSLTWVLAGQFRLQGVGY